LFLLAFPMQIL
jgi:hypothetical protein